MSGKKRHLNREWLNALRASVASIFSFKSERGFALITVLAIASCLLAGVGLCLNVLSAPIALDECLHTHYLWLTSTGHIPHRDFWCHYPALGYVLTTPYLRLFPESIYTVLALRFLALSFFAGLAGVLYFHARNLRVHWMWGILPLAILAVTPEVSSLVTEFRTDAYAALLAISALAIMFAPPPTFLRSSLAVGLSVLSVVIMPKYIHPLFFANLAYLGYGCLKPKKVKQSVSSAITGISTALVLAHGLLLTAGTTLWGDLYWSPLLIRKFFIHCAKTRNISAIYPKDSVADFMVTYFSTYWWVGALLIIGVASWFIIESKKRDVQLWVGSAVLVGIAVFWATNPWPYRQYLFPSLLCLILFVPYTAVLVKNQTAKKWGCLVLVAFLIPISVMLLQQVATDLASGKSLSDFATRQEFLNLIPRTERIVGFCESHPCFRDDLTFVIFEEVYGNPPGFTSVIPRDSAPWKFFQPEYLAKRLEQNPPAAIELKRFNPPGWNAVLEGFVRSNADKYEIIGFLDGVIAVRKDLLKASKSAP